MMRITMMGATVLAAAGSVPVQANSGPVVAVHPVSGLAELVERSEDCEPLRQFDPDLPQPVSHSDISACFVAGYSVDLQALFVVVDVADDLCVSDRSAFSLPNGLGQNPDGALLYFDFEHRSSFAEKMEFSLVERPIAAVDDRLLPEGAVQVSREQTGGMTSRYIWEIDLAAIWRDQNLPQEWLTSGALIFGFDIVIFDRDAERDGSILKWTSGPNDGAENRDLGDLVIWPEPFAPVAISGRTHWPEAMGETEPPRFAHFRSEQFPHVTFRTLTDPQGNFALDLPRGSYRAFTSDSRSLGRAAELQGEDVQVSGAQQDLSLTGPQPERELSDLMSGIAMEHNIPALGIGWAVNGEEQFVRTFGTQANGELADNHTVFRTASITKLVTTMTVLSLVDEGSWDLDRPLADFRMEPALSNDPRSAELTTRMVLRHLTGLPNWRMGDPLRFQSDPGEMQGYSGEAFEQLRLAVEAHTGESLEALAQRYVFGPAEMHDTSFRWSPYVADRFAGEHWATGTPLPHYRGDSVNAAANMLSTPQDLLRFGLWFLDWREAHPELAESLARPNEIELMPEDMPGLAPHGLGWIVQDRDGRTLLEHSGGQTGINTHLIVDPETRSVLVVLTNSSAGWPAIRAAFQATLNRNRDLPETLESLYGDIRF
ncbi:serine hydrolase domain-containing protein [Aurantiacibacter sp. MUD61]|uniref:serine hydrolase domain-containing protein n=1 Tax=Aurantiacibacter sp. MUD61 TaxID=3009083 RepID=UPI0022F101EC|nr:serine hydrolase domain-containing protein [Aurantiacibacter sp. MUD61]